LQVSAPSAAKINHRKIKSPTPTTVEASAPPAPAAEANVGSNGHELKAGEIAVLAYSYWEARGGQYGSAEEDWFRAEQELGAQ
jgi:hypothetical protein